MDKNLDPSDGGFSSRKLWYAIGTSIAIIGVGVFSVFFPGLRPSVESVIGGLLGALAIYAGSNVSNKWVVGKNAITNLVEKAQQADDDAKSKD